MNFTVATFLHFATSISFHTLFFEISIFNVFVCEFQLKDLTTTQQPTRYADDPAYTEDVRHLALPMRRNSGGPDSTRRKSCSLLDSKIFDRDADKYSTMHTMPSKKMSGGNYKYDIKQKSIIVDAKHVKNFRSEDSTSSDDDSSYIRRGQSLDRNIYKQQKKQMLCFQREKESQNRRLDKTYHRKAFSKENLLIKSPRSANEFISDFYDDENYPNESQRLSRTKDRSKQQSMLSLNDRKYSSLLRSEAHSFEQLDRQKSKEMSKFQIGKRFLRGEIGIKSFNYYLLKESLKSSKKSTLKFRSASANNQAMSKSEENIYEEVFFTDKKTPRTNKNTSNAINNSLASYPDCELCIAECTNKNCDICKASELRKDVVAKTLQAQTVKAKTPNDENRAITMSEKLRSSDSHESITNIIQTTTPNVLQYQSYNPKNPGVYKMETTPVAFTSDYNPIEEIYKAQKYAPIHKVVTHKISSSSSDSLHHQKYTKPSMNKANYYDVNDQIYGQQLRPQIYKTDSKASILSEMSIKSENSTNRYYKQAEMSDSSMGDSMFSYPAQRRYYGSAESCRFSYDCQPCYDGDKCSFSDNCRYECRNCDCSSSYFSSDFDDGNFSRKSSTRMSNNSQISNYNDDMHAIDSKTSRYAEDFMKHLNNVKKSCNYQQSLSTANQITTNQTNQPIYNASTIPRDAQNTSAIGNDYGTITKQKIVSSKIKESTVDAEMPSKKSSSGASSKNSSSSSSKSDGNFNKTAVNVSTGTIPKSNKSNDNSIYTMPSHNLNHRNDDARNSKANKYPIETENRDVNECEPYRKPEINYEAKVNTDEHTNDDVFELENANKTNDKVQAKQTVSNIRNLFYYFRIKYYSQHEKIN